MSKRKCGDCRHWDAGLCYRFPPQMVLFPSDNQHPIAYWPEPMQPQVGAEHRECGEWDYAHSSTERP